MAPFANGLFFLAGELKEIRFFVFDLVTKVASKFQVEDARKLKDAGLHFPEVISFSPNKWG